MSAKDEALKAIEHAEKMLASGVDLTGIDRVLLRGALEYAKEQTAAIHELKRKSRAKESV